MPTVGSGGAGATLYFKFTSRDAGVPFTLAGTPVVSVYKDASTTQSVAGVTLTVDFDGVTGLNHISVDTSADGTFYANGHHFELVITTGTVNGTSVVGEDVGFFDLASSIAAQVWDEVNTGATHNVTNSTGKQLRTITSGTTDAIYPLSGTVNLTAATSTTATLDASASAVSQAYQWDVLNILSGTGAGQSRIITDYTTGRVATVSPAYTTTPDATSTFDITPTASVQVVSYIAGQAPLQPVTVGRTLDVSSAGGVTLADAVAHGGTPGSSTATIACAQLNATNTSGDAIVGSSSAGYGMHLQGFSGLYTAGTNNAGIAAFGANAAGIVATGDGGNAGIEADGSGGPGILVVGDDDHGMKILANGAGKKALLLAGDAATDALAIAAGSGSPIDVFDAAGRVTANAAEATAADAVQASPSPTTTAFAGSSALSSSNSFYVGSVLAFTGGALRGLARKITSYTGATRLITVTSAWPSAPTATDPFVILGRID